MLDIHSFTNTLEDLILWSGDHGESTEPEDTIILETLEPPSEGVSNVSTENVKKRGPSMYVTLVEEMIQTVLERESYLFSPSELTFFSTFRKLSYAAKFLFCRLILRKAQKWHRVDSLKYTAELGDENSLICAIDELCQNTQKTGSEPSSKNRKDLAVTTQQHPEIIDLTLDDDEEAEKEIFDPPQSSISDQTFNLTTSNTTSINLAIDLPSSTEGHIELDLTFFAVDHTSADLMDLIGCLSVEELKQIAKIIKIPKTNLNRPELITALLSTSSKQATLHSFLNSSPSRPVHLSQKSTTPISFGQNMVLYQLVMKALKRCIRLNNAVFDIFHRLHLVYFRATQLTDSILTPALLARCRKRHYAEYKYTRTPDVFPSRSALLAYERALKCEKALDELLCGSREAPTNPLSSSDPNLTLSTPTKRKLDISRSEENDEDTEDRLEPPRLRDAKRVIETFEKVVPRWRSLVDRSNNSGEARDGLERFDEGHILTRIVYKGAAALGTLKEYDKEIGILEELLAQRRWRRGKRGGWYERLALILSFHKSKRRHSANDGVITLAGPERDPVCLRKAVQVLIRSLKDPDTHIVDLPSLERRLSKLESKLKLPLERRHTCEGKQKQPPSQSIHGVRWFDQTTEMKGVVQTKLVPDLPPAQESWRGKSLWFGEDNEQINVETLVLQYYEKFGFKGFHSEGRIVSMIFGLLFWDIIFASVPGAFETPFQSAPMDIAEDTFYSTRKDLITKRLKEIEDGFAPEILQNIDDRCRPKRVWCVGVRWDSFEKQDLLDVIRCIGGKGLAVICRLFCEDYSRRTSGVPDLFIWNPITSECKFVEVKGPGDNLQSNQKVWIDVLLRANIPVEICRVEELDAPPEPMHRAKKRKSVPSAKTSKPLSERNTNAGRGTPRKISNSRVNRAQTVSAPETLPRFFNGSAKSSRMSVG